MAAVGGSVLWPPRLAVPTKQCLGVDGAASKWRRVESGGLADRLESPPPPQYCRPSSTILKGSPPKVLREICDLSIPSFPLAVFAPPPGSQIASLVNVLPRGDLVAHRRARARSSSRQAVRSPLPELPGIDATAARTARPPQVRDGHGAPCCARLLSVV